MNIILKYLKNNADKHQRRTADPRMVTLTSDNKVELIPDNIYATHGGIALSADVYRPRERDGIALPVIVFIHGGGLFAGNRKLNAAFCSMMAKKDYVVFSLDRRLIGEADASGILSDICSGLDYIKNNAEKFGGDPEDVTIIGESAGGFLSTYAAAMTRSKKLCDAFGCEQPKLAVKGLICTSGMFYTAKNDPLGLTYRRDLYGDKLKDKAFRAYTDPENPEILSNLPPVFLTTSKGDFLKNYTLSFAKALKKAGHPFELINCKDRNDLKHAFPSLCCYLPESKAAQRRMISWMKKL